MLVDFIWSLFDPRGRIDRAGLVMVAGALIGLELVLFGLGYAMEISPDSALALVVKAFVLWLGFAATSKRLHDLGLGAGWIMAGLGAIFVWSTIWVLVALIGLGIEALQPGQTGFLVVYVLTLLPALGAALWLHLMRGDAGPNRFGAAPGRASATPEPAIEGAATR